jgi:molybdopterin synthase sulfur carrier subunit
MITFQIAGYLTEFTAGRAEIKVDGQSATVGEALQKLWSVHTGLRDRVLTEQGHVRPHINVFVNSEVVRRDQALQSKISEDTEICIMPAVSGGAVTHLPVRTQVDFSRNNTQTSSV